MATIIQKVVVISDGNIDDKSKVKPNKHRSAIPVINTIGLLLCHSHIKFRLRLRLS